MNETQRWFFESSFESPTGSYSIRPTGAIPAPGRVTFRGQLGEESGGNPTPADTYVELHADGSAFAAYQLAATPPAEAETWQLGEAGFSELVILLNELSLQWVVRQTGVWGGAAVTGGLYANPVMTLPKVELFVERFGRWTRAQGTRRVECPVEAQTSADLTICDTHQGRLVSAHHVLAGLLHWFGRAEPMAVRLDGSINPAAWTGQFGELAKSWATARAINVL